MGSYHAENGVLLVDWVLWRPGLGRTRSIVEVCVALDGVLLDLQAITGETASLLSWPFHAKA